MKLLTQILCALAFLAGIALLLTKSDETGTNTHDAD